MFTITKEVYFCYGHRLIKHSGKCRHIHGHSVKASVTIKADKLDYQGMVCDFADVATIVSDYVERELDHNLLLYKEDPLIPCLKEAGERFSVFSEHPTAEFLAQLIFEHIKTQGLNVDVVTLWETASAYATYRESY